MIPMAYGFQKSVFDKTYLILSEEDKPWQSCLYVMSKTARPEGLAILSEVDLGILEGDIVDLRCTKI